MGPVQRHGHGRRADLVEDGAPGREGADGHAIGLRIGRVEREQAELVGLAREGGAEHQVIALAEHEMIEIEPALDRGLCSLHQHDHGDGTAEFAQLGADRFDFLACDRAAELVLARGKHHGDGSGDRHEEALAQGLAIHLRPGFLDLMAEVFQKDARRIQPGLRIGVGSGAVRRCIPQGDLERLRIGLQRGEECAVGRRGDIAAARLRAMGGIQQGSAVAHAARDDMCTRLAVPALGRGRSHGRAPA